MPVHGADRLYIGDQLIVGGKCEIVETYQPWFWSTVNVYKEWYKIKQIAIDMEFYYSWSARWKPQILVRDWDSSYTYLLVTCFQCWNQRWYNYWEWITYWWLREWKNSNTLVSFDSWRTTKSNWAMSVVYSKNSVSYKVWKNYWTWLWQWTANYNSIYQNAINYLFANQWTWITRDNWWMNNIATWNKYDVTITYEPA